MKPCLPAEAPEAEECPPRAQCLSFGRYVTDDDVARRARQAWMALSRAAQCYAYELPPTQEALPAWLQVVREIVDATGGTWR